MSDFTLVWCNYCNYISAAPYAGGGEILEQARREASRGMELHCVRKHPESDEAQVALLVAARQ